MINQIKNQLKNKFNGDLVDALFSCYILFNEKYYLGEFRAAALEGGRFAEVALRMIQELTTNIFIPLGQPITNFLNEVRNFERLPVMNFHESIRVQIPRVLQVIYDIRNKRDIGHISKEINANYTDATLSLISTNWVLAELFRLFNIVKDIDEAQEILNSIVKFRIPIIQDFDGFKKILDPKLSIKSKILILLYQCAGIGCETKILLSWLNKEDKQQLYNALNTLENKELFLHRNNKGKCFITDSGKMYVEENINFYLKNNK